MQKKKIIINSIEDAEAERLEYLADLAHIYRFSTKFDFEKKYIDLMSMYQKVCKDTQFYKDKFFEIEKQYSILKSKTDLDFEKEWIEICTNSIIELFKKTNDKRYLEREIPEVLEDLKLYIK